MRRFLLTASAACCLHLATVAAASEPSGPTGTGPQQPIGAPLQAPVIDHEPVVVTGIQPGPGLWRVTKGDHVLWVMGTLSPLPRGITWDANAVEQAISRSQEVLYSPALIVDADVGMFRALTLIPTALKARRHPDGKRLEEVVSPDAYARWNVLKARYIGRNRGIEAWRPAFAALELYEKAITRSGMSERSVVAQPIRDAAKRYGVPIRTIEVRIPVDNPRQALKAFGQTQLDDLDCFHRTMERIEGDLGNMIERGNAWAIGDLHRLRELPYRNQYAVCMAAFTQTGLARQLGVHDVNRQLETAWLEAATSALQRNRSTFALLPMSQLLKPDGYLSRLQAQGYDVQDP